MLFACSCMDNGTRITMTKRLPGERCIGCRRRLTQSAGSGSWPQVP